MSHARDYWASGAGLTNITPGGKPWPEGEGFGALLTWLVGDVHGLEVGCGPGRLAGLFPAGRYVGTDICPAALDLARAAHPDHRFALMGDEEPLPGAELTLFHTVLLHVPDDELPAMLARVTSPRVIVSEILGRHWRREGDPPVFNRAAEDYEAGFAPRYRPLRLVRHPYPHYRDTHLSIMEFARC